MRAWLLMSTILMGTISVAQQKAIVGEFTKSPTEHIINQIEHPFFVQSVRGLISRQTTGPTEPLQNVLFEMQGPNDNRKIRRTKTDENGRFKIGHVPAGRYRFKATLNGFQSVMGTITVSKKASDNHEIKITMSIGV